ncbi:MAG: bifunctional diaminohydroxyphosphoribosylaminopyrimidine deaminase/5-amino-6-(5-phosphoribosylamino)uracil reductase RibD [Thermodesulfobacteriota bacterium]|nr:bifunctional diaminohydroxyphosphoribosylaminopyrimidine deaminase/5-amino-6-(5-phosphoribosylamino)uracil reductase RibD [Thermodesulfobacteriota bacterium]
MADAAYMEMALTLAEKGRGFTSPNPTVGAVVVKDGNVVGQGWHAAAGKAHAEVMAIDDAGDNARGADIYVTLEPCNHTGRTPPCTKKIYESGIRRVVVAMRDPNPDVTGNGIAFLREKGLIVEQGVCRAAAEKQIEWFVKYVNTRIPFVTLKCAMTLDGRIAAGSGDSRWVSGEASRAFVHELRHASDAIMVGAGTVRADNPRLTARIAGWQTKDPVRVILDPRLSMDPDARMLHQDSTAETIIVCAAGADAEKKAGLAAKARIVEAEAENGRIVLEKLMKTLGQMGMTSLLIEGGAKVAGSALAEKIVDKICFFYAPRILGGDDGIPVCSGKGPALMKDAIPVRDLTVHRFGEDVMMEGYIGCLPGS